MYQWSDSKMLVYRPLHRPLHIQYQSLYQPSINRDLGFRFGRVSVEYQSSVDQVTTIILTNISVNMSRLPIRSMIHQVYHYCDCLKFWVLSSVVMHLFRTSNFICSQTHPPLLFSGLGSLFLLFILLFSLPILLNLTRDMWRSLSLSYVSLLLSLLAVISINVKGSLNQAPWHNHENT